MIYDLTSFSSYSQMMNLLEYGYNRDGLDLPQINLSMIVDKEKGIPVMYDIYPGSIVDVTTLKNTIKKIKAYGVEDYTLVREIEEKNAFYSRIYDVKEKIEETAIPGWRKAGEVFKERAGYMASFYSWKQIDDHFKITIKKNAVSQRINRMGKFFLFYNGERGWMECLTV
ncbi:Mobile element protein [Methanosarcina siciliae T4/M]|uniref:Mobile element protein n=1 Tax=Methanosarcina siciliae T4/M TaxID=1434120 RepID=A0A0E3P5F2_9EURY|nr:Mobile element protein [Methanosarcina siciliae T4/M]